MNTLLLLGLAWLLIAFAVGGFMGKFIRGPR